jgi:DNA-binding XRE family transcriptional regulator
MLDPFYRMPKEEVLALRRRLHKTQRQMALEIGVTERTYRRWENETGATPAASRVIAQMLPEEERAWPKE